MRSDLPWTVTGIAEAVRSGDLDPAEVLAEAIERIEETNPGLQAFVGFDAARTRHPESSAGRTGRLAGVPLGVKDLHAEVVGLPLTRGSRAIPGDAVDVDSTLVARLRAEGATLVGRTSSPEFGLNITTEPLRWGACRNPFDRDRSSGGSSGGSAVAVASGMVPAAHGSDSGGSLRIPAAWCGLVGLKPTAGLNPIGPHRTNAWEGLSVEHALTSTVEDSRLLLEVTSGTALPAVGRTPERVGLCVTGPGGGVIRSECREPAAAVASVLESHGARVEEVAMPTVAWSVGRLMAPVIAAHLAALLGDRIADVEALEATNRELVERGRAMSAADLVDAKHQLALAGREIRGFLDRFDVVVSPSTAELAPLLGHLPTDQPVADLFEQIFSISPFTAPFNVAGAPAISLGWWSDPTGVPLGAQVGASPGADALLLDTATLLESELRR